MLFTNIGQLVRFKTNGNAPLRGAEMNDNIEFIPNAWLKTEGNKIVGLGQMNDLKDSTESTDMEGKWLLPGFCDSHTHFVFADTREDEFQMRLEGATYQEIADAGGGILNSANKLAKKTEDELFEQTKTHLNEAHKLGTVAFEIKSGYGLTTKNELKMLRVIKRLQELKDANGHNQYLIKSTFLAAHAIPAEYEGDGDRYIDMVVNEMLPKVADENLADYIDVFCEKGYFSVAQMNRVLDAAEKFGLKPKVHVNQFNAIGAVKAAVERNAVSADHLEFLNQEDIEALQSSNTIATALPGCSHFLQIPFTPCRQLIDANIPVAIATDFNPGSAPSFNMQLAMSLACTHIKMTPAESLAGATYNGSAAMEQSHQVGNIEKGHIANFIFTNPVKSLALLPYHFGHNFVTNTVINGSLLG